MFMFMEKILLKHQKWWYIIMHWKHEKLILKTSKFVLISVMKGLSRLVTMYKNLFGHAKILETLQTL
jgi:hypothetical protein